MLKLILILSLLVAMGFTSTGCAQLQELRERITQAEQDVNKSKDELTEARKEFETKQDVLNEKQTSLEIAIQAGDFETAKAIATEVSKARVDAATANEKVKQAEKNVDQLSDVKNAAIKQYEDANSPWDYILGGVAILGSLFGVGGLQQGMSAKKQVKAQANKS